MKTTRRTFLTAAGATLAAPALSRVARAQTTGAQAAGLKKLKFGTAVRAVGPLNINFLIGETLGYNKQEGFTIEFSALGTNSNVITALGKGDIDVGVTAASFLFPPYVKGQLPPIVSYFEHTYPFKYDIAVLPDSPVKTYADLKGKKMGVADLGTTDYPVSRALLGGNGINPDKDITGWIAVGNGAQAGIALQRGAIDALAYYDTGFGQLEAAGIQFRTLPRPPKIPMFGGLYIGSLRSFIEKERALAVGYGRSMAKAETFITANPEAGAKVFLEMYPDLKKRNAPLEDSIKDILFSVNRRKVFWPAPYPNTKMGTVIEAEMRAEADFSEIKIDDFKPLYTNDLIDEINNFDVEAVKKQARDYKI